MSIAYTGQMYNSHKDNFVAAAIQTGGKGVPATTGFYFLPMKDASDIDVTPGIKYFQMGGGWRGETWYGDSGDKVDGKVYLPLYPGYVGAGFLYDWMWGRQDKAGAYQGNYATIVKVIGLGMTNQWIEVYQDVKVKSGSIKLDSGLDFIQAECDVEAFQLPAASDSVGIPTGILKTFVDGSVYPYKFKEAAFAVGLGEGDPTGTVVTRNHTLTFDNMVEIVDSLGGTMTPYDGPNSEWSKWNVTFDQWYVSSAIRAAFLGGVEGYYQASLTRSSTELTFTMPRIRIDKAPLSVGTAGLNKQEGISMHAQVPFGGDDTTWACQIAEGSGS